MPIHIYLTHTHTQTQPFLLVEFYCYFGVSLEFHIDSNGSIYSYLTRFAFILVCYFCTLKKKTDKYD